MLVKQQTKKLLTRILSFALAITMCISPMIEPLHAHASDVTTNNQAENTGGGSGSMQASSSTLAWSGTYQGYRMYIIDRNFERISQVYDFVYASPSAGSYIMTTRFDTGKSPESDPQTNIIDISYLQSWCDSSESVPEPTKKVGNERVGNGEQFKKWFFNGAGGTNINLGHNSGGGGTGGTSHVHHDSNGDNLCDINGCGQYTTNGSCTHGSDYNPRDGVCDLCGFILPSSCHVCYETPCVCSYLCEWCNARIEECPWGGRHSCTKCPEPPCMHWVTCQRCWKTYNPDKQQCNCCQQCYSYPCECLELCDGCGNKLDDCTCYKLTFSKTPTSSDPNILGFINSLIAYAELEKVNNPSMSDRKAVDKAYKKIQRELEAKGAYAGYEIDLLAGPHSQLYDAYNIVKGCLTEKSWFNNLMSKWFGYSYNDDILKQNIPLDGETQNTGGGRGMPAYNLVNKNNTIVVPGYSTAGEALVDGCYLVVEPITWLHVRRNTGPWNSASTYNSYRTYGTWYNLASQWVGKTSGSFHSTVMSKLFVNCLSTSKDVVVPSRTLPDGTVLPGGKTLKALADPNSQKDVSVALPLANSYVGISMHIYDSSYFNNTSIGVELFTPETSTYDEPLGRNPGPAPNDSNTMGENDKTDNKKYANIVKFYEDRGSGYKTSYTRTPTPKTITIESEQPTGYVIKDWYTSETYRPASGSSPTYQEYKDSMNKVQSGSSTKKVELSENETTLYVLLVKSSVAAQSDYTLYESEISKPIQMGSDLSDVKIPMGLYSLKDECEGHCSHRIRGCDDCKWDYSNCSHSCGTRCEEAGYCVHGCTERCKDYWCSHSNCSGSGDCLVECTWEINDSSLNFKFKNLKLNNYTSIIKTGSGFAPVFTEVSETRTNLDEHMIWVDGFDYEFVIYRGDDNLNYAKYKYDQSTLGFAPKSVKTTKTRKSADYTKSIVMEFADDGCDLTTTSRGKINGTYYCSDEEDVSLPNPVLTHQVTVLVQTYSGTPLSTDTSCNPNPRMTVGTVDNLLMMGRMISTNTSVKFNPYIQMTWANMSGTKNKVQVLSEYRREILPNDYAEISWTQANGNLLVQSQMWAMDSDLVSVTDDREWTGLNQVLKGGATLQLTDKDKQKVTVSTYQTVVEDTSRNISEIAGTYNLTIAQAEQYHQEFVTSVKQSLDKAELIQWVSTYNDGGPAWDTGFTVTRGSSISGLNNGSSTASTESKYYLESDVNDTSNTQRADLDIKELGIKKNKYRFYSDVEGNIWMKKTTLNSSGAETGSSVSKILTKHQGISDLTNSDALRINSRTYAVTKLLAALERNSGSDRTASWATSDGTWYNEAYDGITVYEQHTDAQVGLTVGVNPTRIMVLDPKLIPQVTSKNDQGKTAFSSAFKVNLDGNAPMGKFKGSDIFMASPDMLFNSRNIYITNMTVDDTK